MFSSSPTNLGGLPPTTANLGSLTTYKSTTLDLCNYATNDEIDLGNIGVTFAITAASFFFGTVAYSTGNYMGVFNFGNFTTHQYAIQSFKHEDITGATIANGVILPGWFKETMILNATDNLGLYVTQEQIGYGRLEFVAKITGYVL